MKTFATNNVLSFTCVKDGYCCQNWGIFFSKDIIKRINDSSIKEFPELKNHSDFYRVINKDNPIYYAYAKLIQGRCVFLKKNNTCRVFEQFGKSFGNQLCLSYPFLKIKCPDRYAVITSLACTSELQNLFIDEKIRVTVIPDCCMEKRWPVIDCSENDHIMFSDTLSMTWSAYYALEKYFIDLAGQDDVDLKRLLDLLVSLHNQMSLYYEKVIDEKELNELLTKDDFESFPSQLNVENILYFVQRKINLYHFSDFVELTFKMFQIREKKWSKKDWMEFNEVFKTFDPVMKKYFSIVFFSNPTCYIRSIQFFLHVLFFYIGFIKLFAFSHWLDERELSKEIVAKGIQIVERHFFHDAHVFEFWGQKRRVNKDFHENSLVELMF